MTSTRWRPWPPALPCFRRAYLAFGPLDEIADGAGSFIERFFHSERSQVALARRRAEN